VCRVETSLSNSFFLSFSHPFNSFLHLLFPQAFGVADGVWGWRNQGIDSGIFSRAIMAEAAAQVRRKRATMTERKSPSDLLKHAVDRTRAAKHLGSST